MHKGLRTSEVAERIRIHGYNELPASKPKNVWHIALEVMKEPMFVLLVSCGVLYIILGDYNEGVILLSTILIIIFITFYQYAKTEKSLEALKRMASPRALVIRDGKEIRIPGREVVPDDIILLNEGDRIAADAQILETMSLVVDESLLTGESVPVIKSNTQDGDENTGLLFSGTLVVQGKGIAKVLATGSNTRFGKIGRSLEGIRTDETRLQSEMKTLIRNLFFLSVVISLIVVLSFYFTRGNFLQSLLNGLAASMAILPEEFPVVLTVFLALGAWRLSKKNVLTRRPSAIETLGSATVLCSDKTGTITQNRMEIVYMHNGTDLFIKDSFLDKRKQINELLRAAFLASQKDTIDPMEKAIVKAHNEIIGNEDGSGGLIREYPVSKELFAMTRVLRQDAPLSLTAFCKGAPEAVFALCHMGEDEVRTQLLEVQRLAGKGYRVIATANASFGGEVLPETQSGFEFTYLGLLAFEDPVRAEVPGAIKECNEAGIKVIMITGDFPATAKSIASRIGMDIKEGVLTGDDLKAMSDDELKIKIQQVNIFARVVPEQKLRIVEALKANNEIVAMTGDGVNDAPALKAAHIGIAMGGRGTDVAREASSLVLLDDNFASIVSAIRLGRKIFDNLQKAMSYIIAIHIPIIVLALIPAFNPSLSLLLLPLHIVFMELIIDPVCSVAFESEQEEEGIMSRPPRDPADKFFGGKRIAFSAFEGTLLLVMVVIIYFQSIAEGHSEGEVRAIAFSSLIIGNIFLILTKLSKTRSFISSFTERNRAVIIIVFVALIMLFLINSVPVLRTLFSFEFPGYRHFISSITGAALMLGILEGIKYFSYGRFARRN